MPTLSKDAEIELLTEAFARFSDPSGWPAFLNKISDYLDCKTYAVEYREDGTPTGRFTGQDQDLKISEILQATTSDHGVPALDFLLHHARSQYVYQVTAGHLSALEQGAIPSSRPARPDLALNTALKPPGLVGIIKSKSRSTILLGILFPDQNNGLPPAPASVAAFLKIYRIVTLGLTAFDELECALADILAYKAIGAYSGVPAVLINGQKEILAELAPGLDMLAALDAATPKDGKLLLQNRALETCMQAALSEAVQPSRRDVEQVRTGQSDKGSDGAYRQGFQLRDTAGDLRRITVERLDHQSPGGTPWILIRILHPTEVPETVETILQEEFALSQSEAHLARMLAITGTVPATTDTLNITRNTMKTHLRRIFDKTGMRTQLELVHLVHKLTGLV